MPGYAANLESKGYKVMYKATEEVIGNVKPYSITGSLPLVNGLQVCNFFQIYLFLLLQT